jgi:hypothetical protein
MPHGRGRASGERPSSLAEPCALFARRGANCAPWCGPPAQGGLGGCGRAGGPSCSTAARWMGTPSAGASGAPPPGDRTRCRRQRLSALLPIPACGLALVPPFALQGPAGRSLRAERVESLQVYFPLPHLHAHHLAPLPSTAAPPDALRSARIDVEDDVGRICRT